MTLAKRGKSAGDHGDTKKGIILDFQPKLWQAAQKFLRRLYVAGAKNMSIMAPKLESMLRSVPFPKSVHVTVCTLLSVSVKLLGRVSDSGRFCNPVLDAGHTGHAQQSAKGTPNE